MCCERTRHDMIVRPALQDMVISWSRVVHSEVGTTVEVSAGSESMRAGLILEDVETIGRTNAIKKKVQDVVGNTLPA